MPETSSIFNKVAQHYDLLNSLFTLGIDKYWRKSLVDEFDQPHFIIDVATGTCEVAIEAYKKFPNSLIIGLDPTKNMVDIGKKKIKDLNLFDKIKIIQGYAEYMPIRSSTFDAATIAFGIRNTVDPVKSLTEIYRVLKPRGKLGILEFSTPSNKFFSFIYLLYFRHIMPLIGSIFGSKKEYKYLSDSTAKFPQREELICMMDKCGFVDNYYKEILFGIVIIYIGNKH